MSARLTALPKSSPGFTLVEMLMAMLVMTVGLLGLLQSVQVAYQQGLRDRVRNEAVLVAEGRMHDWRRMSYDAISATNPKIELVERTIAGATRNFSITSAVAAMGGTVPKPAKKLSVGVTWTIKGEVYRHEIYTMRIRRADEN